MIHHVKTFLNTMEMLMFTMLIIIVNINLEVTFHVFKALIITNLHHAPKRWIFFFFFKSWIFKAAPPTLTCTGSYPNQ